MKNLIILFLLFHLIESSGQIYNSAQPSVEIYAVDRFGNRIHTGTVQEYRPTVFQIPYISTNTFKASDAGAQQSSTEVINRITNENKTEKNNFENWYMQIGTYPSSVADGWHEVICWEEGNMFFKDVCLVQVVNNKIVKGIYKDYSALTVSASGPITAGKSILKSNSTIYSAYFVNYIIDPSSSATPHTTGKVSFATTVGNKGQITIRLEGPVTQEKKTEIYYEQQSVLNCEAEGTVTFNLPVGKYKVTAYPSKGKGGWSSSLEVTEDQCEVIWITDSK